MLSFLSIGLIFLLEKNFLIFIMDDFIFFIKSSSPVPSLIFFPFDLFDFTNTPPAAFNYCVLFDLNARFEQSIPVSSSFTHFVDKLVLIN